MLACLFCCSVCDYCVVVVRGGCCVSCVVVVVGCVVKVLWRFVVLCDVLI